MTAPYKPLPASAQASISTLINEAFKMKHDDINYRMSDKEFQEGYQILVTLISKRLK